MAIFAERLINLLYPGDAVCIACGALRVENAKAHLCQTCAEKLIPLEPPFCPSCGRPGWAVVCPRCLTEPKGALDARMSAFVYTDTAQGLVRALKYGHVEAAADALAEAMARVMPVGGVDALVPVPLHRRRERQRGFNQAQILSDALSRLTGIPVMNALTRERATRTQTRLTREQRWQNTQGAFRITGDVLGLSLLLIDDVLTTGATAISCADALKVGGAAYVALLTAARAKVGAD